MSSEHVKKTYTVDNHRVSLSCVDLVCLFGLEFNADNSRMQCHAVRLDFETLDSGRRGQRILRVSI